MVLAENLVDYLRNVRWGRWDELESCVACSHLLRSHWSRFAAWFEFFDCVFGHVAAGRVLHDCGSPRPLVLEVFDGFLLRQIDAFGTVLRKYADAGSRT